MRALGVRDVFGANLCRLLVHFVNLLVDFLSVNRDVLGSANAKSNLFASNFEDDHFDLIPDHDALLKFPR